VLRFVGSFSAYGYTVTQTSHYEIFWFANDVESNTDRLPTDLSIELRARPIAKDTNALLDPLFSPIILFFERPIYNTHEYHAQEGTQSPPGWQGRQSPQC
jgi:hypothetical protein